MTRSLRMPLMGVAIAMVVVAVAFGLVGNTQPARSQPTDPPTDPSETATPTESETPGLPLPTGFPTDGEVEGDRIGGTSRIETAVLISQEAFPDGADDVFLAQAGDFPDALAAGALTTGPILLVPSCDELPDVVADELARLEPTRVVALGGTAAVCDEVLEAAVEAAGDEPEATDPPTEPSGTESPTETESPGLPLPFPSDSETPTETETPVSR